MTALHYLMRRRISWQVLAALANLALWAVIVFSNDTLRQHASWIGAFIALFMAAYVGGVAWDRRHPKGEHD